MYGKLAIVQLLRVISCSVGFIASALSYRLYDIGFTNCLLDTNTCRQKVSLYLFCVHSREQDTNRHIHRAQFPEKVVVMSETLYINQIIYIAILCTDTFCEIPGMLPWIVD